MLADLNRLITYTNTNKLKLVIGIDSNAHSSLWGSEESNRRGEILEEWLLTNGLFVANVGDSPTFTGRGSNTIVDITVSTMDIQIRDWAVLSKMAKITDHVPITFNIPKSMTKVIKSRSLAKCDWHRFRHELSKQGEIQRYDLWSVDRLNAAVDFLENKIISALDVVAPLKSSAIKVRSIKPWSPELSAAYKTYIKSKKLHKEENLDTYTAMKAARREFRQIGRAHV